MLNCCIKYLLDRLLTFHDKYFKDYCEKENRVSLFLNAIVVSKSFIAVRHIR